MAIAPHSTRSLYLFYIRAWLASVKVQPYGIICGRLPEGTLAEFLKYSWPEKWLVSVRHIVCYSTQQTLAISLRRWFYQYNNQTVIFSNRKCSGTGANEHEYKMYNNKKRKRKKRTERQIFRWRVRDWWRWSICICAKSFDDIHLIIFPLFFSSQIK